MGETDGYQYRFMFIAITLY